MATTAVPTKAEVAMPSKSVPAERPKATANMRRTVVEVVEVVKVKDRGRAIDIGWTFIAEVVSTLVRISEIVVVGVIASCGGVRSLCRAPGNC
jgi:hypothetical protein